MTGENPENLCDPKWTRIVQKGYQLISTATPLCTFIKLLQSQQHWRLPRCVLVNLLYAMFTAKLNLSSTQCDSRQMPFPPCGQRLPKIHLFGFSPAMAFRSCHSFVAIFELLCVACMDNGIKLKHVLIFTSKTSSHARRHLPFAVPLSFSTFGDEHCAAQHHRQVTPSSIFI